MSAADQIEWHVDGVVKTARALESELNHYKNIAEEQADIIRQLSGEPTRGGVTYIHPHDFIIIINAVRAPLYWLEYRDGEMVRSDLIGGVRYKQSAFMPVHFKGIIR